MSHLEWRSWVSVLITLSGPLGLLGPKDTTGRESAWGRPGHRGLPARIARRPESMRVPANRRSGVLMSEIAQVNTDLIMNCRQCQRIDAKLDR